MSDEVKTMPVIFKYVLNLKRGIQVVNLPYDAEVVSAQMQHNMLCIWAVVPEDEPTEPREFEVLFTGERLPESDSWHVHIGTVQHEGFVWHVFELRK